MLWVRSLFFLAVMYTWMGIMGLALALPAALTKTGVVWAMQSYARHVIWLARVICGLRVEIRGKVPSGNVLIASKHQSFFDVIIHTATLPRVNFIMKQELIGAPILGLYALKLGCVPIKRGKGGKTIESMIEGAKAREHFESQLVIYPQGTRVAPGAQVDYKIGTALLAQALDRKIVPVAVNVGLFWPRRGVLRKPGLAVIEYLDPMEPDGTPEDLTRALEAVIEPKSDALMAEAGFKA